MDREIEKQKKKKHLNWSSSIAIHVITDFAFQRFFSVDKISSLLQGLNE